MSPRLFQITSKTKPAGVLEVFSKRKQKRSPMFLKKKDLPGVPGILPNYLKIKKERIPEGLSNYFNIKTYRRCLKLFQTTSKTNHKGSLKFFQTMYFKSQTQGILEILSNFFKNKTQGVPEILSNYFKDKTQRLRNSKILPNYCKKEPQVSPRSFQTT